MKTFGTATINLNGVFCTFHVTPDYINLDVCASLGCDILLENQGYIDMELEQLKLGNYTIPFVEK